MGGGSLVPSRLQVLSPTLTTFQLQALLPAFLPRSFSSLFRPNPTLLALLVWKNPQLWTTNPQHPGAQLCRRGGDFTLTFASPSAKVQVTGEARERVWGSEQLPQSCVEQT